MEDLLKRLRELREEKGISLDEIHKKTRIPKEKLLALEEGKTEQLPEPIFIMGYAEKFIRALGEDPKPFLEELKKYLEEKSEEVIPPPLKEIKTKKNYSGVIIFLILVVIVLAILFMKSKKTPKKPAVPTKTTGKAETKVKASRKAPEKGEKSQAPKNLEESAQIPIEGEKGKTQVVKEITISATGGPCWIRYITKEGLVKEYLLHRGDSIKERGLPIVLRAGNAASLRISIGGKKFAGFGKRGEVINLKIDKKGVEKVENVPNILKAPFPPAR